MNIDMNANIMKRQSFISLSMTSEVVEGHINSPFCQISFYLKSGLIKTLYIKLQRTKFLKISNLTLNVIKGHIRSLLHLKIHLFLNIFLLQDQTKLIFKTFAEF